MWAIAGRLTNCRVNCVKRLNILSSRAAEPICWEFVLFCASTFYGIIETVLHKINQEESGKGGEERTKLMSWWWQLLLDHGNESVENGNESLNLRRLPPYLRFTTQNLFFRTHLNRFKYCYTPLREITLSYPALFQAAAKMCYKIIKQSKKWSESKAFITSRRHSHHSEHESENIKRRNHGDCEGWLEIILTLTS